MAALESTVDMYDLRMSEEVRPLYEKVKAFIAEEVQPMSEKFFELGATREDRWGYAPGQLELLQEVKDKAKANGLWNFFLPDAETGEGLSNLDYAYIAIELGKNPLASESMNCAAPDTGNMEVLERVGTEAQKEQWLKPLLAGEIRSAYAMTEPDVASSDAKNVACQAERDGDEWLINGEKYYISGAGDPRCKIMITMVQTSPDGPPHQRQSQILVPIDTPGVQILGPMHVFGKDDAPARPHAHQVRQRPRAVRKHAPRRRPRLSRSARFASARAHPPLHACHRAGRKGLEMMVSRGLSRDGFGKPLAKLGGNTEMIAKSRIEIESMRRMVLTAANAMDKLGNSEARVWVSAVKAMVPIRVCEIIDNAIQMHGATGVSQWTPLADMYTSQRTLRLADGPDEVHWMVVGRKEVNDGEEKAASYNPKETFLANTSDVKEGAFSGPA